MRNNGVFRNVNIIKEINAASQNEIIEIYKPGNLNSLDVVSNLRYSGFITSLRLTVELNSIDPLNTISSDILASDATIAANNQATFEGNHKKCIRFLMQNSDTPLVKVTDVYMFNQRPYYYIDMLRYFTSSATLDIAPDTQLYVQVIDVGNGFLQNDDRLLILGTVIEESPILNQSFLIVE